MSDLTNTNVVEGKHIVVTTIGSLKKQLGGRDAMDLSALRVIVIDEVEFFFKDERNKKEI